MPGGRGWIRWAGIFAFGFDFGLGCVGVRRVEWGMIPGIWSLGSATIALGYVSLATAVYVIVVGALIVKSLLIVSSNVADDSGAARGSHPAVPLDFMYLPSSLVTPVTSHSRGMASASSRRGRTRSDYVSGQTCVSAIVQVSSC